MPNHSSGKFISLARTLLSLLFLFIGNWVYEFFCAEIRHTAKDKVVYAKSSMYVDLKVKFLYTTIVVVNLFVYDQHPQLFQVLVLACSGYSAAQYMYFLPYYSIYINKLKIICVSIESFAALAFLIGYMVDDAQTILTFTIFTTPCGCFIVNYLVEYRRSFIRKINPKRCNPFMLELYLREQLADTSCLDREILNKIDKSFFVNNYKNCQLMGVWQAYYCIDVIRDYRMAFIKLSKCWSCAYSLPADFQTYKCSYMLNSIEFMDYEDLSYIRYALKLENLKKEDMNVCVSLLKFWGELIGQGDLKNLNILVEDIGYGIVSVQTEYQYLIENYPSSNNCREFFRTFLTDIVSEVSALNHLTSKMNSNKEYINSQTINYFDDSNGVILISGNEKNIGEIIYSNSPFAEILNQRLNTIIGSNISVFIPELYSKNHNQALTNFVNFCLESEVPFSGTLFLQTEKGYLVESVIKSRCSAIKSNVFFLVIIKRVETKRHIILYNHEGIIFSYSKDLPDFLGFQNLKMMKMMDIFEFSIHSMDINVNYERIYRDKPVWVSKTYRKVGNTLMSILLIYESEAEVSQWGQDFETFEDVKENMKHVSIVESKIIVNTQKSQKVAFADDINPSMRRMSISKGPADGNEDINELILMEKKSVKSSQASASYVNINERYSKKILLEALRGIKFYKWILLIFVSNI